MKPESIKEISKENGDVKRPLVDEDFRPSYVQKGVDMRIGIDIASLALKKQVDRIVLFSGDALWLHLPEILSIRLSTVYLKSPLIAVKLYTSNNRL